MTEHHFSPGFHEKLNEGIDRVTPCAYCKSAQSLREYATYSISGDNFHINRCLKCGAMFLSPAPTQEELNIAYDDSYYGDGEEKFGGFIEKVLDYFRSVRGRRVMSYISPPAKVLDIGCGNGRFLGGLIEQGFDGYGIELAGRAAQRAGQVPELKLKTGSLTATDFEESFFDCICMWHVFEHLTEPKETLKIIDKILKPCGYLMISMPNIDSFQSRLFGGNWLHLDPPKHLFFLKSSDLISEMEALGFEVIKQNYFSLEQNPFGMQQSILNCLLGQREVLFEALKGNDTYIKKYSQFSILLQKLFYMSSFPLFVFLAGLEAAFGKGGTMELIFRKID